MDTFLMTGCSAGSLGTFTWIQTAADMIKSLNPKVNVIGMPDSGYFVDYPSNKTGNHDYATNIKAVVELANGNESALPNQLCMADNPENPHFCLMAEKLVKYINTPIFIQQSLYDNWQYINILQIPCSFKDETLNNCSVDELAEVQKFSAYT
jgi:hypothetical protein